MLRQRRIQIIRRNRNYSSTIQYSEPIQAAVTPSTDALRMIDSITDDQRKNPLVLQR